MSLTGPFKHTESKPRRVDGLRDGLQDGLGLIV